MSHITKVKTKLKDGHVLRKALKRIGYRVQEGGIISTPYERGNGRAVEITAVKESCKLGFIRSSNNDCYEILADWDVQKRHRKRIMDEIFQVYSHEKVVKVARFKGYSVIQNRTNRNGQVELILRKVA